MRVTLRFRLPFFCFYFCFESLNFLFFVFLDFRIPFWNSESEISRCYTGSGFVGTSDPIICFSDFDPHKFWFMIVDKQLFVCCLLFVVCCCRPRR